MNEQDYELLSSYADNELDDVTAQRLQTRLASEPELRATLERIQELNSHLQGTFSHTNTVPHDVAAMVQPAADTVVPFKRRQQRPAWQYAVAASLVAAAGLMLAPSWDDTAVQAPTLAAVLETTPSMAADWIALEDGREIRPVLSFYSVNEQWCREYIVSFEGAGERGVACRAQGNWEVQVAAAAQLPGSHAEFRPAGAGDADAVADYLAEQAAEIALSAEQEQAIIEAAWQD